MGARAISLFRPGYADSKVEGSVRTGADEEDTTGFSIWSIGDVAKYAGQEYTMNMTEVGNEL